MTANATLEDQAPGSPDPFESVADAMRDAVHAATEDATRAKEKLRNAGPEVMRSASRFTYTSCYMVSYGIVYATVFLAKSIPQDNPVVEGFIDGGRAAIDAVNEAKGIAPASHAADSESMQA